MLETLLLAIGLSMDTFSVAAGFGCANSQHAFSLRLRMALVFGLAHIIALVGGWWAGSLISGPLGALDHWVAFILLAYVGLKMIQSSLGPAGPASSHHLDVSHLRTLLTLAVATALDAVVVGASLALAGQGPWILALATGSVVFAMVLLGAGLGRRLGVRLGPRASLLGGVVLLAIGLRILLSHLG